jgi:carbamate kinase
MTKQKAIITSLDQVNEAVEGRKGTIITYSS